MPPAVRQRGLLYDQAAAFAARLEGRDQATEMAMLNAWSDSYWGVRREMDQFLAKVAAAKAAGERVSPAWAFQQRRIQTVMDQARTEMARYADQAAGLTTQRQRQAVQEGLADARDLGSTVIQEGLPGLDVDMSRVNTAVLEKGAGFLADGTVLRNHLAATMPEDAAQGIRDALIQGLARGKSQDWMTRQATRALGLSHGRAVTILRTESLRAYRAASQAVYEANADTLGGWVWNAHLDSRTCVACVLMDGTEHPLNATLDGHPRCRCAMIPRTRSWEDILGADGADLPDTRPPVRSGKAWLEAQSEATQRAIIGRAKFTAWQEGHITLDDMVARTHSDAWGTMRTERSLKAITEGRNANWTDADTVAHPTPPVLEAPRVEAPEAPADPFAGTTDDQLRARMVTGSMSERRAAQTELVRRKDAATVKAGEDRRAILDRYAGDGTTWNRVDELPDTYQRGRHTAIVREDLGDDLDGFLADAGDALDRMPEDLRRITVLVPRRGTDKHFRDSPTGITGGYVTEGLDFVNINPTVARGLDVAADAKARQFMPGAQDVTMRQWTLNHELGHIMDHGHGHTHDARPAGAVWRKNKADLSRYGQTHRSEGYAEAWAQWSLKGPGSNPVADAYAREYGWPPPRRINAPDEPDAMRGVTPGDGLDRDALRGGPGGSPEGPPGGTGRGGTATDNPFTGADLADALSPTRKRTKAAILKDLEATPEGKALAAQIKAFTETRGGVANLRKNLAATIDGTASPAVKAKSQAFLDALDAYPTAEVPELFRGMAVKVEADTDEWWDAFEGQFQPGQTIDLSASSFTSSEKKAAEFSGMIGGTRKATSNYTAVRFYLEEGAHALPVESLSKFKTEREWITGGRFEVVEFSRGTAAQPYTKVVIRQVKGLGQ